MPNIIDTTYFQKANGLNIPLSQSAPISNVAMQTPNNVQALELLIAKVEKSILLNALGLTIYNELQLALADINNPLYASYKKLVQGDEYNDKLWNGLDNDNSLIAWRIYEEFVSEANTSLTAVGTANINPEKANLVAPHYRIANANANFITQYQGGYLRYPIIYDDVFIDWFGGCDDSVEVSLYQYLVDKVADFDGLDIAKFKVYETKNSFGI
jgi:hypothetical protein